MFRNLFNYYGYRNFSQCRIFRNLEKVKPEEPQKAMENKAYMKMDFVPSEFDKKVLVWSGKFKSTDSIPNRIGFETLENARSRLRIRVANMMMIATLGLCGYFVWLGKKKAAEGDSITKRYNEMDARITGGVKK